MFTIKMRMFILFSCSCTSLYAAWNNAELDLFDAITRGDGDGVDYICSQNVVDVDEIRNIDGHDMTPLLLCVSKKVAPDKRGVIIEKLIQRNADVNKPGFHQRTPLHQAVAEKDFKSALLLVNSGAKPEQRDNLGYTALDMSIDKACTAGFFKTLLEKLANKAAINAKYGYENNAFLFTHALARDRVDLVGVLLDCGADCNVEDGGGNGILCCKNYPLHSNGLALLLQNGFDVNRKNKAGNTVLDDSVARCKFELVSELLFSPSKIPLSMITLDGAFDKISKEEPFMQGSLEKAMEIRDTYRALKKLCWWHGASIEVEGDGDPKRILTLPYEAMCLIFDYEMLLEKQAWHKEIANKRKTKKNVYAGSGGHSRYMPACYYAPLMFEA